MSQQENAITAQLVYTVDQAAAALGKGRNYIYEEISAGRLKSVKMGSSRRIAHVDLVAFLDALRKDSASVPRESTRSVRSA